MKNLLLITLIFSFIHSYAQKIDLDKRNVNIEQAILPQNNALVAFNTYNVSLVFNPSEKQTLGFSDEYLKDQLNLDGYKYVKENGDFLLNINVDKITLVSDEILETSKETKNSAGQMVKTTSYTGQLKYSVTTTIQLVENSSKRVIEEFRFASDKDPIILNTLAQTSKAEAEKFNVYNKKNLVDLTTKYKGLFSGHMNKIKSKYAYKIYSDSETFWEIDAKKAPEFAEFNQHLNNVLKVLEGLKAGGDLMNARQQVAPDLAYWSDNGKKIAGDDKSMKKLKYAYYYNLSKAQLYLEMLDESEQNANILIQNDYDARDGKEILAKASAIRTMLKNANASTWHSSRLSQDQKSYYNVSENMGQLSVAENNQKTSQTPQGFFEFPGELTTIDNTTYSGKLISKKDFSDNNLFSKTYGAAFIYTDKNGIVKKMGINPDSIASMNFGPDLRFHVYKFDNNQDLPVKRLIFKDIGKNRKIQYLKYFNSNLDLQNELRITKNLIAMEHILLHRESGKMAAVGGWGNATLRERTANFYAQFCPEMKEKILNNIFGNKNSLSEWHSDIAGYYVEKCK